METTITVSPLHAYLALAFQVWMLVFPIVIIRKLNYLIALFEDSRNEES